jgi:hypothetical protein
MANGTAKAREQSQIAASAKIVFLLPMFLVLFLSG